VTINKVLAPFRIPILCIDKCQRYAIDSEQPFSKRESSIMTAPPFGAVCAVEARGTHMRFAAILFAESGGRKEGQAMRRALFACVLLSGMILSRDVVFADFYVIPAGPRVENCSAYDNGQGAVTDAGIGCSEGCNLIRKWGLQ
jgi:hypothetical protein